MSFKATMVYRCRMCGERLREKRSFQLNNMEDLMSCYSASFITHKCLTKIWNKDRSDFDEEDLFGKRGCAEFIGFEDVEEDEGN